VTLAWERFDAASLPGALPFARPLAGTAAPLPAPTCALARRRSCATAG
jgi:hypothetical protein